MVRCMVHERLADHIAQYWDEARVNAIYYESPEIKREERASGNAHILFFRDEPARHQDLKKRS